ncbi:Chitin synthase C, partial [Bienertia sinuspersici]
MSYVNRSYDSEVIHEGPYGSYSAEYRIDEYGNRVPHHQHHHHHNGIGGVVSEIVGDITDHHHHHQHHHHDRPAEVIRESPCDSYSGCNRVEPDYRRPGYPIGHHHHHNNNNIVTDVVYESSTIPSYGHHHHNNNIVTDVVYESSTIPSYGHHHHHHHHGGPEIVERKEETIIYENDYEPYGR